MTYEGFASTITRTSQTACTSSCQHCPSRSSCLAKDLNSQEVDRWSGLVGSVLNYPAGKSLFEVGDSATVVYSVRAGCIKTFTLDAEGNERVQGFHMAGDIIGLECLTENRYPISAISVSPTQICVLSRSEMRSLAALTPALMNRLVERLSQSLRGALCLSGDYSADQRVAAFLLQMQVRLSPLPGKPIHLPMGRRDIASYLRLATETVCRVLTRFEKQGLLKVSDRKIEILDHPALKNLSGSLLNDGEVKQ